MEFLSLPDLAVDRLGGVALAANDEFFASRHRLVLAAAPVWKDGVYDDHGKWMDGWETRRRRVPGSDWCIVKLGLPGIVRGVVIDTSFFTGNYPEFASIEACEAPPDATGDVLQRATWSEVLVRSALEGNTRNTFAVASEKRWTHLKLHIYPDGGVARLRVHGEVMPDWHALARTSEFIDVAAIASGGRVIEQSDAFYGNANHMLLPGRSTHMGDGWETKRRRGPGNDWAIVKLGRAAVVSHVEVDTEHFKGNAPGACSIDGTRDAIVSATTTWTEIVPRTPLSPHTRHTLEREIRAHGAITHARLNIYPDGGVARLRLFSRAT